MPFLETALKISAKQLHCPLLSDTAALMHSWVIQLCLESPVITYAHISISHGTGLLLSDELL